MASAEQIRRAIQAEAAPVKGEWTGVVKKTKPDGVPKPRGRAPLGATWDGLGVNFAVFSAHAERIELCIFDPTGRREIARYDLPEWTDEVWHGYLPHVKPGLLYGFRAHGPYEPQRGHRFNPNKLLVDPYAKALHGETRWTDALFGYRVLSPRGDLSYDRRDSAPAVPKAVVVDDSFSWGDDRPPNVPWSETVIYEAHVKGLTKLLDDVRIPERGTYSALAHPAVARTAVAALDAPRPRGQPPLAAHTDRPRSRRLEAGVPRLVPRLHRLRHPHLRATRHRPRPRRNPLAMSLRRCVVSAAPWIGWRSRTRSLARRPYRARTTARCSKRSSVPPTATTSWDSTSPTPAVATASRSTSTPPTRRRVARRSKRTGCCRVAMLRALRVAAMKGGGSP